MNKAIIVTHWFYFPDGSRLAIGGNETLMLNLIEVLKNRFKDIIILQQGTKKFTTEFQNIPLISFLNFKEQEKLLYKYFFKNSTIVIFSDYHVMGKNIPNPSIMFQQGIYWDTYYKRFKNRYLQSVLNFKKKYNHFKTSEELIKKLRKVDKVITVDTNFQNFIRAYCTWESFEKKFVYIPNFAEPYDEKKVEEKWKRKEIKRILFARRFESFRGTFIWANVVKKLAKEHPEIEFIFCGRGDKFQEQKLKNILKNLNNIKIYERSYDEMKKEHFNADIEVVPSFGSEGTSFSLIEAMASGSAVITTTVGGLANIVIPDYNGIIVQATEEDLYNATKYLIENPDKVRELGERAYEVVKISLNKKIWKKRILLTIEEVLKKYK